MALARESGWTESYILETLPLARLMLYIHALHWAKGDWTVPPTASVDDQLAVLGL